MIRENPTCQFKKVYKNRVWSEKNEQGSTGNQPTDLEQ